MTCRGANAARAKKAALVFPRPTSALRPVVRGQTVKYNLKQKLGRGFTFEELKVRPAASQLCTCKHRRASSAPHLSRNAASRCRIGVMF